MDTEIRELDEIFTRLETIGQVDVEHDASRPLDEIMSLDEMASYIDEFSTQDGTLSLRASLIIELGQQSELVEITLEGELNFEKQPFNYANVEWEDPGSIEVEIDSSSIQSQTNRL